MLWTMPLTTSWLETSQVPRVALSWLLESIDCWCHVNFFFISHWLPQSQFNGGSSGSVIILLVLIFGITSFLSTSCVLNFQGIHYNSGHTHATPKAGALVFKAFTVWPLFLWEKQEGWAFITSVKSEVIITQLVLEYMIKKCQGKS